MKFKFDDIVTIWDPRSDYYNMKLYIRDVVKWRDGIQYLLVKHDENNKLYEIGWFWESKIRLYKEKDNVK